MFPNRLALIDDDSEFTEYLGEYLREQGIEVTVYANSNDLLVADDPYAYDFFVVDLMLPGIDGVNLVKVIRGRSNAGILVVSGRLSPDVFREVITAGADMYLSKPVQFEQVLLVIEAVQRRATPAKEARRAPRSATARTPEFAATDPWKFDRRARRLVAPDRAVIDLSDADCALFECFVEADGGVVTRETLRVRTGGSPEDAPDTLNATIYRLRRRIERSTPIPAPLQSKSRIGYSFKAPLEVA